MENASKEKKKNFYLNRFVNCIGDSRQVYRFLNELKGANNSSNQVQFLIKDGKKVESEWMIANKLNDHFADIGQSLSSKIEDSASLAFNFNSTFSMWLKKTNVREVQQIINELENKTSLGVDDVSNVVLKISSKVICPILVKFINKSFRDGKFPKTSKFAKIIPLYKSGPGQDVNNYRPIALLPVWSKVFERVIFNRIYPYLERTNYICENQFGFRKKYSIFDAITKLTLIRKNSMKTQVVSVFLDLQKAFYTINHEIL